MAPPGGFPATPPCDRRRPHAPVSSSPDLPSVQEIISQNIFGQPLRGGSKNAPIPEDATAAFTRATSLCRSFPAADGAETVVAATWPLAETGDTESVTEVTAEAESKSPKARRPKHPALLPAKTTTSHHTAPNSPNIDQPWRKYKSPSKERDNAAGKMAGVAADGTGIYRAGESSQSHFFISPARPEPVKVQPPMDQVKESAEAKNPEVAREKAEEDMDKEAQEIKVKVKAKTAEPKDDEPLLLERAMTRRADWTPPAKTTRIVLDSDSPDAGGTGGSSQMSGAEGKIFGSLLAAYKCQEVQSERSGTLDENSSFLKKRKLLELIPAHGNAPAAPPAQEPCPVKPKGPKKKARTITGLATAAYRPATQHAGEVQAEDQAAKPVRQSTEAGKGKTRVRKSAAKPSKKAAAPPRPKLLSPGAAMQQVAEQDFVFGTSSQLAREQSPSLLRDLQTATRMSNQVDRAEYAIPLSSDAMEPAEKRPLLWEAAARDVEGDLFDMEVLNLANGSQRLPERATWEDPFGYVKTAEDAPELPSLPAPPKDSRCVDEEDLSPILSDTLPVSMRGRAEKADKDGCAVGDEAEVEEMEMGRAETAGPLLAQAREEEDEASRSGSPPPLEQVKRPALELLSDAQLAKQVASYGFKPIKTRTAMIALLDRCWQRPGQGVAGAARMASTTSGRTEAGTAGPAAAGVEGAATGEKRRRGRPKKQSAVDQTATEAPPSAQARESPKRRRGRPRGQSMGKQTATVAPPSAQARGPPKRPRGRPRKGSGSAGRAAAATSGTGAAATAEQKAEKTVIEIADSESDGSSTRASSLSPEPAAEFELSVFGEETELPLAASASEEQTEVGRYIGKAVKTAGRTREPTEPSWHEKMLLYDPIVLEDLTAWLNCGQLTRVGYDGEVSSAEVKRWCESKSICCLWKANLRGKERKRY